MRAPWKLDPIEGYHWTEQDAAFEREDGFWAGAVWGLVIGAVLMGCVILVLS
jgi:hypothetical protein